MNKQSLIYRIYDLYADGFRNMTIGKTLWTVILIKLFVIFAVLKVFFLARGTLMALFLSTTVFPAETIQIPVYAETCVLLDDLMAGGWYA